MATNPTITPGACAIVDVAFDSEVFSGDNAGRQWSVYRQSGGVTGALVATGNYPSPSQPADAWSVSGDPAAFLTGPVVCAPLSAGSPAPPSFDGYVLRLKSETNGSPIPVVQYYQGAFTVSESETPVDPPARPPAPTIHAVGHLVNNAPQIDVSGN